MTTDYNQLHRRLLALGYDARPVNGDCFDIHQDGGIHYLSTGESEALTEAGAGLSLIDHAERRGVNYWYTFAKKERV